MRQAAEDKKPKKCANVRRSWFTLVRWVVEIRNNLVMKRALVMLVVSVSWPSWEDMNTRKDSQTKVST